MSREDHRKHDEELLKERAAAKGQKSKGALVLGAIAIQLDHLLKWRFAQIGLSLGPLALGGYMLNLGAFFAAKACFVWAAIWGILVCIRARLPHKQSIDRKIARVGGIGAICLVLLWLLSVTNNKERQIRLNALNEWLVPANDPTPPNPCDGAPKQALKVLLGNMASFSTTFPSKIIGINGDTILTMDRNQRGEVAITTDIYDQNDEIVTEVDHNHFNVSNDVFEHRRTDESNLTVVIKHNKEKVLDIRFLNPSTIQILGVFRHPNDPMLKVTSGSVEFMGSPVGFYSVCSGDSRGYQFHFKSRH